MSTSAATDTAQIHFDVPAEAEGAIATAEAFKHPVQIDEDGCAFNPETGEFYDPEFPGLADFLATLPKQRFEVVDRDTAETALAWRAELEAEIGKLQRKRDAHAANLNFQIGRFMSRIRWWEVQHWSGVVKVARQSLSGRSKTAAFDHAKVSFRNSAGSTEIIDKAAAVDFVLAWLGEDGIKRAEPTTTIANVKLAIKAAAEATGESYDRLPFLVSSGPKETVDIKTGILAKGGDE